MILGFISDAHGNVEAFNKGISILLAEGAKRLFFLGDAIGYIPSYAVLNALDSLGEKIFCIRGNHEAMLLDGRVDLARDSIYQLEVLRTNLPQSKLKMISSWPVLHREMLDGLSLLLVHGSPESPTYGYVYPDTNLAGFSPDADWVFMANTHHPFIREQAGIQYVNIGSCGMPRDDGRFGSAGLLDTKTGTTRIFRFDICSETKRMLEEFPIIHPSVRDLYSRRQSAVFGDIF